MGGIYGIKSDLLQNLNFTEQYICFLSHLEQAKFLVSIFMFSLVFEYLPLMWYEVYMKGILSATTFCSCLAKWHILHAGDTPGLTD